MDGGAWKAVDRGVAKSRTRLSDFLSLFTFMHWRRKWQPTPVFLPGESQGRRSLVGCRLWGHTESDTTDLAAAAAAAAAAAVYNYVNQLEVYIYPLPLEPPYHLPWVTRLGYL